MYSQNFYNFFSQVDNFHTTESTFAFFSTPIPHISHLSKLGHSPKKFEKVSTSFKTFFAEVWFFEKNVVSSA